VRKLDVFKSGTLAGLANSRGDFDRHIVGPADDLSGKQNTEQRDRRDRRRKGIWLTMKLVCKDLRCPKPEERS
jgi:hypothetical protein